MTKTGTVEKTFVLPEARISEFKASITRLQHRAQKLGCGEITFVIGEPYYKKIIDPRWNGIDTYGLGPRHIKIKYYPVNVSGTAPVLAGWLFIAKIEHDPEIGNIIFALPSQTLPKQYREADLYNCDHCHKTIRRRDTFIVQHQDTSEYKQVGRQCLRDFLGHESPESIAKYFELLSLALSDEWSNEDTDRDGSGRHHIFYEDVERFLIQTSATIREYGWCSIKTANEDMTGKKSATADRVAHQLWEEDYKSCEVIEQDKINAKETIEWFLAQKSDLDNDYIYNTNKLAEAGVMRERHAGLVASMMFTYLREMGRLEHKERFAPEYFGEVKQRLPLGELMLDSIYGPVEGQFGPTFIYRFVDEKHLFVWFTGKRLEAKAGDKVTISKATIKEHKEYKGQKETIITRVNVQEEEK